MLDVEVVWLKFLSGSTVNNDDEFVLSEDDKKNNFVLFCDAEPLSDLEFDVEDLSSIKLYDEKIVPAKISLIE